MKLFAALNYSFLLMVPIICTPSIHSQTILKVWGDNEMGQLGLGFFTDSGAPPYLPGLLVPTSLYLDGKIIDVEAGFRHSIALKSDGSILSWGSNFDGELGIGIYYGNGGIHQGGIASPQKVLVMDSVAAISSNWTHNLALKNDGTVWAWGSNWYGELGVSTSKFNAAFPTKINELSNIEGISAGSMHNLALTPDGKVWSWGRNSAGQLGLGFISPTTTVLTESISTPHVVPGLSNVVQVAAGDSSSFALLSDGTIKSWGDGGVGELGNGIFTSSTVIGIPTPITINNLTNVISIAASGRHVLALKSDGTVWSWGFNPYGQLGRGVITRTIPHGIAVPAQINSLNNIERIASGFNHSIAINKYGTVYTWGWNSLGQLGDGTLEPYPGNPTPKIINGLNNVFAISGGRDHSLAIISENTKLCFSTATLQNWQGSKLPLVFISVDKQPMKGYVLTPQSVNSGTFTIRVLSSGVHTFRIKINGYLTQKISANVVGNFFSINFAGTNGRGVLIGDTDNNNVIDENDILNVINSFGSSDSNGDTNGDGIVDETDLLNVINNFSKTGDE